MKKPLCLLLILVAAWAFAANAPARSAVAGNAYQRMVAKLNSISTYQATIHATFSLQPTTGQGKANTVDSVETVLYKRPNKLSLKAQGLMGGIEIVSNGANLYEYSPLANQYSEQPAPQTLTNLILESAGAAGDLHQTGTSVVNGVSVAVVKGAVSSPQGDGQATLYIGRADNLPYRLVYVLPHLPGQQGSGFRLVRELDFTRQKVNAPIPGSAFHFSPPAGATKVPSLGFGSGSGSTAGIPGMP